MIRKGRFVVNWNGRVSNDRTSFDTLAEKLSVIERSNNWKIIGLYINLIE